MSELFAEQLDVLRARSLYRKLREIRSPRSERSAVPFAALPLL